MEKNNLPIGFFDSGVGGISVMAHAANLMPNESFIYYGDDANAPYGSKSEDEIRELSFACGEFLYKQGVKAMVMACNTATSTCVQLIRDSYNLPVISMEPAVKPASEEVEGDILVMATAATLSQKRYHRLVDRIGCRSRTVDLPMEKLAGLLEQGDMNSPQVVNYIREKLSDLKGRKFDAVVIGCTHYSFVSEIIKRCVDEELGCDVRLFDGMYGTVRQLGNVLKQNGLLADADRAQDIKLFTSGGGELMNVLENSLELARERFR